MIKVLMFGNFPTTTFRKELNIEDNTEKRFTSWNANLFEYLKKHSDLELHAVTTTKLIKKTTTIKRGNACITFIAVPPKVMTLSLLHYPIWKAKRMIKNFRPDITHGIGTEHIWAYASSKFDTPYVITVHGILNSIRKIKKFNTFSRMGYLAFLEKKILKDAKHIIQINPFIKDFVQAININVNYYPISNPISSVFIDTYAKPYQNNKILFIGDFDRLKNVSMLLDAVKHVSSLIKDVKVHIIGQIKDRGYYNEIRSAYKDIWKFINIENRLLHQNEMAERMKDVSMLVLTSKQESAPMVIAEAMATGLPVVATNVGGVKRMIKNGENGFLIEPNNIEQLSSIILKLLNNPDIREKIGKKAKIDAIELYNPKIIAQKTYEVYKKILQENNV